MESGRTEDVMALHLPVGRVARQLTKRAVLQVLFLVGLSLPHLANAQIFCEVPARQPSDPKLLQQAWCPEPPLPPPEPPPLSAIIGYIDGIVGGSLGGWACSTGLNAPVSMHMYVGGPAGSGTYAGSYGADLPTGPAVAAACQASGTNYGFQIPLGPLVTQHGGKTIFLHGMSPVGNSNALLTHSGEFSIPVNQAPTVSLTSPAQNASGQAPATFVLKASASDPDDGIASVAFYANNQLVNTDTVAPYEFAYTTSAVGQVALKAVASDTRGASTTSAVVTVNVTQPPSLSAIKGYIEGVFGGNLHGWACSTGRNEPVNMHMYVGGPAGSGTYAGNYGSGLPSEPGVAAACQASGTNYRFQIPLAPLVAQHSGKTIFLHGMSPVGNSNELLTNSGTFHIPANQLPAVSLTSPAQGASGQAPATFVLKASASDPDDGIASVAFYANNQLVNTDTVAPYEFAYTTSAVGQVALKAVASDTRGASTTSAVVTVNVTAPPPPPPPGGAGVSRRYVYDNHQQLCKVVEPETGATVMDYDAAGNLKWSAAGHHDLTSTGSCNRDEGYGWGRRVNRSYDERNRLRTLNFPDNRGNQVWEYTSDGLPASIATYNAAGNGEPVINAYSYNKRRMLIGESVAQPGWYIWGIGYGYDANGSLSTQSYPTGLIVNYAPNALGQPTQAGSYATGVQYYPNGAIKQFTYGNGIVHTMTQNARQLPARVVSSGNALDHAYTYDPNANVSTILDYVVGTPTEQHRTMQYDGLDRLTATGSQMFGGDHWHRFTYDALDNLKSWKLAGVKDYANYYYEPSTGRLTNIQNTAGASVVGLGYDVQGNLANKNGQVYGFDFGNRLREVTGQEYYRYDGHGRRVVNWRPANGGEITVSQYSQSGQVVYQEQTGKPASEHIYLGGSLVATRAGGVAKYQHTDALGSPVAVTNTAGVVIERTNWEPYGAAIGKVVDGVGYTGHVMDGATGLTYMQQRYYDPGIGRFLSVDPVTALSDPVGYFGRYHYAANNPYKFTDPDGRAWGLLAKAVKLIKNGGNVGATAAGAVEDGKTLMSRDASLGQRLLAAGSLATEVLSPVSARDAKAGINAIEGATGASKRLGADAPLQRYQGPWTERDIARGMDGKGPLDIVGTRDAAGREMPLQLHHPDQLPGRGVHEVSPAEHRTPGLHPHPNRGVTDEIRTQDREQHWKQRARDQGGG